VGQLVVVSNRVAVPEKSTSARAGGLEVAVNALKRDLVFGLAGAERLRRRAQSRQKGLLIKKLSTSRSISPERTTKNTIAVSPTASSGRFFITVLTWPNFRAAI
jgi:hypothetical protein